jgi:hypothetical protein
MATVTAPSVEAPSVEAPSVETPPRPGWGAAMLAAGFVVLARPALWPVALAAFLLRGGIVALTVPLLILPSPTGVANVAMPLLSPAALGRITPTLILVVVAVCALLALAILIGGLLGAWLDAELIREAAEDEELGDSRLQVASPPRIALAGLVARLAAYVPFGIALGWGLSRLIGATYTELILPQNLGLPLAVRVLGRAPDAVVAIGVTWILGEVVSGLALRHLVLDARSVARALRAAVGDLVRHPASSLATTVVTDVALAVVAGVGVLAAVVAVERLRFGISVGGSPLELTIVLMLVAGTWAAALLATGALTAFRSVAWTYELTRRRTIGDGDPTQPGDWAPEAGSGTL